MTIQNLTREKNYKDATVNLNYDEIRCICNSLHKLSEVTYLDKDTEFNSVRKSFIELFALIKHGFIPPFELEYMYELLHPTEDKKEGSKVDE